MGKRRVGIIHREICVHISDVLVLSKLNQEDFLSCEQKPRLRIFSNVYAKNTVLIITSVALEEERVVTLGRLSRQ